MSNSQRFRVDWAAAFRENAARHLLPLRDRPLLYLEIGVFEGRSACWMLDNVLLPMIEGRCEVVFRNWQLGIKKTAS